MSEMPFSMFGTLTSYNAKDKVIEKIVRFCSNYLFKINIFLGKSIIVKYSIFISILILIYFLFSYQRE